MTRAFMAPMVELNATPIHVEILCLVGFFFLVLQFCRTLLPGGLVRKMVPIAA